MRSKRLTLRADLSPDVPHLQAQWDTLHEVRTGVGNGGDGHGAQGLPGVVFTPPSRAAAAVTVAGPGMVPPAEKPVHSAPL